MSTLNTFNLFGWEIRTPKEFIVDKIKESLANAFMDYLIVSPIVIVVSIGVYMLVGMFSKSLAKMSAFGIFLYSIAVFLFA